MEIARRHATKIAGCGIAFIVLLFVGGAIAVGVKAMRSSREVIITVNSAEVDKDDLLVFHYNIHNWTSSGNLRLIKRGGTIEHSKPHEVKPSFWGNSRNGAGFDVLVIPKSMKRRLKKGDVMHLQKGESLSIAEGIGFRYSDSNPFDPTDTTERKFEDPFELLLEFE